MKHLPRNASVLIQGYSAPGNSNALHIFLREIGVDKPHLMAVDLFDVREMYSALDISLPDTDFHIADATALPSEFCDGFIDLVVQDFLINCLPPKYYFELFQETARILSPTGLSMINFTDNTGVQGLQKWSPKEIFDTLGVRWDISAYQLADIITHPTLTETLFSLLHGAVVEHENDCHATYVTPIDGHFEFFPTVQHIVDLLQNANLELIETDFSIGRDNNGLQCCRHHYLVRKTMDRYCSTVTKGRNCA